MSNDQDAATGSPAVITKTSVVRFDVRLPDDEFPDMEDRLFAVWHPKPGGEDNLVGDYWLICGDNTGSQQLVVYPYMVEPLRALLAELASPEPPTLGELSGRLDEATDAYRDALARGDR